jgi:hypothetical protein
VFPFEISKPFLFLFDSLILVKTDKNSIKLKTNRAAKTEITKPKKVAIKPSSYG